MNHFTSNYNIDKRKYSFSFRKYIKNSFRHLMRGEWLGLGYFLMSETSNYFLKTKLFYANKKLFCPICKYSSSYFRHLSNPIAISWNSACPNCDSRSRHRGLLFLYAKYFRAKHTKRILHFAPEPVLTEFIKYSFKHHYMTTDLNMCDVDYPSEDVQKLSFEDSYFDIVLSNHVLEHVKDDEAALNEMARILKKGGQAIITVPGDWRRKKTKEFLNLRYNGHYRDYGLDILQKMENYFSKVKKINLFQFDGSKYGIKKSEIAFLCTK